MKKSTYQSMIDRIGVDATREYFRKKAAERRATKREEVLAYRREWHAKNRETIAEKKRITRKLRSKEEYAKQQEYDRKRREDNPQKIKAWMDNWRKKNKDHVKAYDKSRRTLFSAYMRVRRKTPEHREKMRSKYANDPSYAIMIRLRARVGVAFRKAQVKKSARFILLTGCTQSQLINHIEKGFKDGMSWENRDKWHVDHYVPCSYFDLSDPTHQRMCFNYLNLRPEWGRDNCSKKDKLPSDLHDHLEVLRQSISTAP